MKHKYFKPICAVVIAGALLLAVVFMNGGLTGTENNAGSDAEINDAPQYFTINDMDDSWDTDDATRIALCGDSGTISGNGAFMNGKDLVISDAGRYIVSGELSGGNIIVDADDTSKVWILLEGVKIYCPDDAAIRINHADKVFLTLAENSENIVSSGEEYSADALADNVDSVIFAHDDLTINGTGSLMVSGGYQHGIAANDDLVITGGTISVSSVVDAIHVNDSLNIKDIMLTVDAGDDGIVVDEQSGSLYIESGTFDIAVAGDGIHAGSDIIIQNGSFEITAGDDGIHSDTAIVINGGAILIRKCYEGIEAQTIEIKDGEITIYCLNDGINANGGDDAFANMGTPFHTGEEGRSSGAGDGRMHSGAGEGRAPSGEAGGEPPFHDPENGTREDETPGPMHGEPGPNGDFPMGQPGDQMNADVSEIMPTVTISGGKIVILNSQGRDADGIDSNGDIIISGGEVYISLNGSGGNCALDYGRENGGTCKINGGIVVAAGSSMMLEKISSGSEQASIVYVTNGAPASLVVLADSDGKTVLTYEIPLAFTAVTISCPELQTGNTYTISIGDISEELTITEIAGTYGGAIFF